MSDLNYYELGLFTMFCPNSPNGEKVYNSLCEQNHGSGKVLTTHAKIVINKIRAAGYTITKGKPVSKKEIAELSAFMDSVLSS